VSYSVGEAADFARVTVRTLRHYDAIGLFCPRGRSAAGYRRYGAGTDHGYVPDPEGLFEVFGDWRPREGYAEEAERRWGDTEAWRQSRERMAKYTKEDLLRMHAETREWVQRLRAVMQAGATPRSKEAMDLAEEHRRHLDRWWFDCDHDLHLQLTELLVTEPEQLDFLVRPRQQMAGMGKLIRDTAMANAERAR
jgi:hypothetical protein